MESLVFPTISTEYSGESVKTVLTDYSLIKEDNILNCDSSSNNIILTLPDPSLSYNNIKETSYVYIITKIDSNSNYVKVVPFGSETIGEYHFFQLDGLNDTVELISNGTNWNIINNNIHMRTSSKPTNLLHIVENQQYSVKGELVITETVLLDGTLYMED